MIAWLVAYRKAAVKSHAIVIDSVLIQAQVDWGRGEVEFVWVVERSWFDSVKKQVHNLVSLLLTHKQRGAKSEAKGDEVAVG